MKSKAGFVTAGWIFSLSFLLLASCSTGSTPSVKYYTMSPFLEMPPGVSQGGSRDSLGIGVGPVEFPKFLDRPQIVTRESRHRVVVSEFHRWAGSFSEDFLRVLARDISMLLPSDRVAVYPWNDLFSPSYVIRMTVDQFDARFRGNVVLNVTWSIWNPNDTHEVVLKHTRIEEPVSAENFDAVVAAQSRAIATLSQAIVKEIDRVSNR